MKIYNALELAGFVMFLAGVVAVVLSASMVSTTLALVAAGFAMLAIGLTVLVIVGALHAPESKEKSTYLLDEKQSDVNYDGR